MLKILNFFGLTTIKHSKKLKAKLHVKNSKLIQEIQVLNNKIRKLTINEAPGLKILKRKSTPDEKDDRLIKSSKLRMWSKRIRQIGKCDICESEENLTAHHLWDKSTHPSLSYQDENGVCLCEFCHNGFHNMYTNKTHCTPSMFQKYKQKKINQIVLGYTK